MSPDRRVFTEYAFKLCSSRTMAHVTSELFFFIVLIYQRSANVMLEYTQLQKEKDRSGVDQVNYGLHFGLMVCHEQAGITDNLHSK